MQSTSSKVAQQLAKPVLVGAISYLGSMAMGNSGSFYLFDKNVSVHTGYAIAGVASDFVAEVGHNWILPYIPTTGKFAQTESLLLAPALGAAGMVAAMYLIDKNAIEQDGVIKPALLGAGSVMAGQYAYDAFLAPYI